MSIEHLSSDNEYLDIFEHMVELALGVFWGLFLLGGNPAAAIYKCAKGEVTVIIELYDLIMDLVKDVDDGNMADIASAFENAGEKIGNSVLKMIIPCK